MNVYVINDGIYNLNNLTDFLQDNIGNKVLIKIKFGTKDAFSTTEEFEYNVAENNVDTITFEVFSSIIVCLRKHYCLTQPELSRITSIPYRTIQNLESKNRFSKTDRYLTELICFFVWGYFHGYSENYFYE